MKRFTILSIMLFFCVSVFAQNAMTTIKNNLQGTPKAIHATLNNAKAIIWQDDFSVSSNWTLTETAGSGDNWVIGTTAPSGSYPIGAIASTTAANGFALFDSDLLCSGNQVANLTNATSFSCTGHSTVGLTFEQYYKRYYDSTFVFVSNNGTTWTKFVVNQALGANSLTANPLLTTINISSVAANQATVWIRFQFYSPSSLSSGGCGYAWMVDDVKVMDLNSNDITATKSFLNVNNTGYYEVIPYSQMGNIQYGESVSNSGSAAQTNVTLNVNINAGAITSNSTPVASLASGANDTLWTTPTIPVPATPTLYAAKLSVSQTETDANPTNNIGDSLSFVAYPNYFSRTQQINSILTPYSFGTSAPATNGMEYGATYTFPVADRVDSISAIIYSATANTSITGKLYTVSGTTRTLVAQSAPFTLVPANLPAYITVGLTTPYTVAAGTKLCATVALNTVIANHDTIAVGADDAFKGDASVAGAAYLYVSSAWGWYTVTSTVPTVDLVLYDPTTGIKEANVTNDFKIFPNPASDALNIVSESNIVSVKVINTIGQVVISEVANSKSLTVNTSMLSGMYFVQVQTEKGISTEKVMIK